MCISIFKRFETKLFRDTFLKKQKISLSEVVYIGPNYYPEEGVIDWIPIIGMISLTLMIVISCSGNCKIKYKLCIFSLSQYIQLFISQSIHTLQ